MLQTRIDKTLDRLRAGQLPAAPVLTLAAEEAGQPCSGCGEPLEASERYYYLRGHDGESLRFHLICHEVWVRFKRR